MNSAYTGSCTDTNTNTSTSSLSLKGASPKAIGNDNRNGMRNSYSFPYIAHARTGPSTI